MTAGADPTAPGGPVGRAAGLRAGTERLGIWTGPEVDTARFSGVDAIALVAVTVLAALTACALLLADLHVHTLPRVVGLTAGALVVVGVVAWRNPGGSWPGWVRDRAGLLVLTVVGAVAAVLTLPGFPYGAVDKDPGGYVAEGIQIANSGSYSFTDPALVAQKNGLLTVHLTSPGARFAAIWEKGPGSTTIVPQFYHAHPALLALGWQTAHELGLRLITPLEALVAIVAVVAALRRIGGRTAALAGGLLLATNMLQVWQARDPSSEALAEAMWAGAVYAVVVAVQTGWGPAGGIAGLCVAGNWLDRADGLLEVAMLAGLGAVLLATRRWDRRAWWGLAGFGIVAPLAAWQAYAGAALYTRTNSVPSLPKVLALLIALFVIAAAFAVVPVLRRMADGVVGVIGKPAAQTVLGVLFTALVALLVVVGYLRPRLFGASYGKASLGQPGRTYDEANLHRLTFFFSYAGIAVACLGLAVLAVRRWRTETWLYLLPGVALAAVYLLHSHNSPQLMFWGRRYVPSVVPFICGCAGVLAAVLWGMRRPVARAGALLATAGLVAYFLTQSVPIRQHEEWTGSFALSREVAALSGGTGDTGGVFLVGSFGCCEGPDKVLGAALWLERQQLAAPLAAGQDVTSVAAQYVRAFPKRKVFLVEPGTARPDGADGLRLTPVFHTGATTSLWQERLEPRPDKAVTIPEVATVWRVDGIPAT